jgi:hypothetical protein
MGKIDFESAFSTVFFKDSNGIGAHKGDYDFLMNMRRDVSINVPSPADVGDDDIPRKEQKGYQLLRDTRRFMSVDHTLPEERFPKREPVSKGRVKPWK